MDKDIEKLEQLRRNIDLLAAHFAVLNNIDPAGRAARNTKLRALSVDHMAMCEKIKARIVAGRKEPQAPDTTLDSYEQHQAIIEVDSNPMWVRAQTVVSGWIATVLGNTYDKGD